MRKDVKFGLTIGGILVVTLVIYVIVLSRGPEVPQKLGLVMPGSGDSQSNSQQAEPLDITPMPSAPAHTQVADNSPNNQSGVSTDTPTPPAAAPNDANAPATQPAQDSRNDWEYSLNHGLPPSLSAAAPQRTDAPMIDSAPVVSSAQPVARDPNTPMIDSLPTTQPSPPAMMAAPAVMDNTAPDPTAQPATTPGTHRVAAGESLYSISRDVYGNSRYYKKILAANPGINPHRLKIGQVLTIPVLSNADRNPTSVAKADEPSLDRSTAYRVVAGDTLEGISRKLYGTSAMVNKLYQLNKALIGSNQDVLKVGWVLKLPSAPRLASASR